MKLNLLTALRIALPTHPSIRDLAEEVGCSHAHLAKFELGEIQLNDDHLAAYARLVHLDQREVRRRWLMVALEAVHRRRLEIEAELRDLGVSDPRLRRGRKRKS